MKIESGKLIDNGSAFSEPGKGAGLLFWLIIIVFAEDSGVEVFAMPALYVCFLLGFYILFSRKYLEFTNIKEGKFKIRIGIGRFSHGGEKSLSNYKYGLLQQGTWIKNVKQGVAGLSVTEGTLKEKFIGVFLVSKEDNMKSLLFKGSKDEAIEIIKQFLLASGINVYNGAFKKGAEMKL